MIIEQPFDFWINECTELFGAAHAEMAGIIFSDAQVAYGRIKDYQKLYANPYPETHTHNYEVMRRCQMFFADAIEDAKIGIILRICKLTDSAKDPKGNENISIYHLLDFVSNTSSIKTHLQSQLLLGKSHWDTIREIRNKLLAHSDKNRRIDLHRGTLVQDPIWEVMTDATEAIAKVCDIAAQHHQPVMDVRRLITMDDSHALIHYLDEGWFASQGDKEPHRIDFINRYHEYRHGITLTQEIAKALIVSEHHG
jgi:AbiU2